MPARLKSEQKSSGAEQHGPIDHLCRFAPDANLVKPPSLLIKYSFLFFGHTRAEMKAGVQTGSAVKI